MPRFFLHRKETTVSKGQWPPSTSLGHAEQQCHLSFSGGPPLGWHLQGASLREEAPGATDTGGAAGRVPFGRVSEEIAANLSSIWNDRRVVEKGFVTDLHLEKLLVPSGQLLGPGAQRQQQPQHTPAEQHHPGQQRGGVSVQEALLAALLAAPLQGSTEALPSHVRVPRDPRYAHMLCRQLSCVFSQLFHMLTMNSPKFQTLKGF